MNARAWIAAVVFSFAFASQDAAAAVLRFDFEGKIVAVNLLNGSTDALGFALGNTVGGSFLFDEGVGDSDADPLSGFYQNSVFNFRFGTFFAARPAIDYSLMSVRAEVDQVAAYANVVEGGVSDVFQFNIYSVTGRDVILDDRFDLRHLNLADYPECSSACLFFDRAWLGSAFPTPVTSIAASLTNLRVTPVPEPGSLALLVLGLLALAVASRRRWVCLDQ